MAMASISESKVSVIPIEKRRLKFAENPKSYYQQKQDPWARFVSVEGAYIEED